MSIYRSGVLAIFAIILTRIGYLQLMRADYYRTLSDRNCTRLKVIPSLRGTIFDCTGKPFATNRPLQHLTWNPPGQDLRDDQYTYLMRLFDILSIPHDVLPQVRTSKKTITLKRHLDEKERAHVVEARLYIPYLQLHTDVARWYPGEDLACHAIGYMSTVGHQSTGKIGLERICDTQLQGQSGTDLITINAQGTPCHSQLIEHAQSGQPLMTCLDYDLCAVANQVFPTGEKGCILLMQAHTGHLKVALSWPTFDPHIFLQSLSEDSWKQLTLSGSLLNRCTQACYPPASLFKLITLAAALEMGICSPSDQWNCSGKFHYCGRDYHCANRRGHGPVTVPLALGVSCNIPFFDMAQRLKIDTLAHYARALGLGSPTGCILPEKSGLVPSRAWKKEVYKQPWWPGETLSVAVGQGALLVTPLQVLNLIHGIMHGYLVNPRLLVNEPLSIKTVPLAPHTREFLQQCMKRTVEKRGTGSSLGKLHDMVIYAKTGTSQVSSYHLREISKEFLEHAWFTAHITYKNHDPVILVIVIEHVGSSSVAAQTALKFLSAYADTLDKRYKD